MRMKQTFWITKDEEGRYLPKVYIGGGDGSYGEAVKAEWDEVASTMKRNLGLTLVKVTMNEEENV